MSQKQKLNSDGRLFAILAYIIPILGGIIGLAVNRGNPLTRNHSYQSIGAVLLLILSFVGWAVVGYVIAIVPTLRDVVVMLSYALVVIFGVYVVYRLFTSAEPNIKYKGLRRLAWLSVLIVVIGGMFHLGQVSPETVAFGMPGLDSAYPLFLLLFPISLLGAVILLGSDILSPAINRLLSIVFILNLLTWIEQLSLIFSVALFSLVIAIIVFMVVNWVIGLLKAVRGKPYTIPLANRIVTRVFGTAS